MIPISKFASEAGNPLCDYFNTVGELPENKELSRIWFLAGDPTAYGHPNLKMDQKGYDFLKQSIMVPQNHGYIGSVGDPTARKSIAQHFSGDKHLTANDVIIVHGANMGLLYCLFAFCEQGDNILIPELGYPFYNKVVTGLNIQARQYRLKENSHFEIDLDHLQSLVSERTKFIFVINPSNPMGTVFSKQHMLEILNLADFNKIPLVVDQVYFGQSFEEDAFVSFGHLTNQVPVIAISGMQKIYFVPGWCTSWIMLYDKCNHLHEIRTNLEKIATLFLHTNVFTQKALPKILDALGSKFSRKMLPLCKQNHDYLISRFKEFDCFRVYPAQGTLYLMVEILLNKFNNIPSDIEFIKKILAQENVNAVPISIMGNRFNGLRMMTCSNKEHYDEFFVRLHRFVKRHSV